MSITIVRREKIKKKANAVRELYELKGPLDLAKILAKENIKLLSANLDDIVKGKQISGILRIDKGVKEIYINKNHIGTRNSFTVGHQLGHYYLHEEYLKSHGGQIVSFKGELRNGTQEIELEADLFSSELLMPKEEMFKVAKSGKDTVAELAGYFKVSLATMKKRVQELNHES